MLQQDKNWAILEGDLLRSPIACCLKEEVFISYIPLQLHYSVRSVVRETTRFVVF